MNKTKQVNKYDDHQTLSQALMSHIKQLAELSANQRGQFYMALSGGSLMDIMASALDQEIPNSHVNWSTWQVFWADERLVPWQSPESNYGMAMRRFLSRVPIPEHQIHGVDTSQPLEKAARLYAALLETVLKPTKGQYPRFDLILLGIGPDGHTASLFPNHPVLDESREWVSPVWDAPKPPPKRITLTLPVINHARHIAWVATGPSKAEIVHQILNPSPISKTLPAGMVNPIQGETHWFVDQEAATNI